LNMTGQKRYIRPGFPSRPGTDACAGVTENHEEMIKIYDEIDTLRKEADSYHSQLTEKFKNISPLRKKISALKNEMPKLRMNWEFILSR